MFKFIKPYQKPHPLSPAESTTSAYHLEVPTMLPQRLLRTTTLFSSLRFHQIGLWISLSLHLDIVAHFHVFFCPRLAPKLMKGPYLCSEFPLSLPSEKFAQSLFLGVGDLAILILFVGSLYVMLGSFSPRVIEGEALAKHLLDLVQGQSLYIVLSFIPLWIIRDTRHPNPMTIILNSKLCSNIAQIYLEFYVAFR